LLAEQQLLQVLMAVVKGLLNWQTYYFDLGSFLFDL